MGKEFGLRPSEVLGLDDANLTWRLHFDFAVLHNLKTMEAHAQAENPEAGIAREKSASMSRLLEKKYGKAADADEVARALQAE